MELLVSPYLIRLQSTIESKINEALSGDINSELGKHLNNSKSREFHEYYFKTLSNSEYFLEKASFFKEFRTRYSLQGIDNDFMDIIEGRKKEILKSIEAGEITKLYFDIFFKARIKSKDQIVEKDLSSFFTKLIHTFRPNEYCALDNPIRHFLGIRKESFFIGFVLISSAYKKWAFENQDKIKGIKRDFSKIDSKSIFDHSRVTDMKLIDLVMWAKANTP